MNKSPAHELRPGITNPELWYPDRSKKSEWNKIRKVVLERDKNTCQFCGHVAKKWMNVHHIKESEDNNPKNLITSCVACHAVLHLGNNMRLGILEVYKSEISQNEIVQLTREGIKRGESLETINKNLPINVGKYSPDSIEYVLSLLSKINNKERQNLRKPLCAVFVNLKRWQIE